MTLTEEIQLRIEFYGGAEQLALAIEKEWKPKVYRSKKYWTALEIKFLKEQTEHLAFLFDRKPINIGRKIYAVYYDKTLS